MRKLPSSLIFELIIFFGLASYFLLRIHPFCLFSVERKEKGEKSLNLNLNWGTPRPSLNPSWAPPLLCVLGQVALSLWTLILSPAGLRPGLAGKAKFRDRRKELQHQSEYLVWASGSLTSRVFGVREVTQVQNPALLLTHCEGLKIRSLCASVF